MEMRTITICVDAATADAYEATSEADRRKIDVLLNLKLKDVVRNVRPLEVVMTEISRKAQERGLTLEILESILAES
ncbi:hypothetical protein ACQ4N7_17225 [Nodosilinea sp. AN01ver1]|uniref:hypothetical protein n=1 Tax=Nodosilinea sp. AN01ver1 TaxID=3423362 RepID=UPI003D31B33C